MKGFEISHPLYSKITISNPVAAVISLFSLPYPLRIHLISCQQKGYSHRKTYQNRLGEIRANSALHEKKLPEEKEE